MARRGRKGATGTTGKRALQANGLNRLGLTYDRDEGGVLLATDYETAFEQAVPYLGNVIKDEITERFLEDLDDRVQYLLDKEAMNELECNAIRVREIARQFFDYSGSVYKPQNELRVRTNVSGVTLRPMKTKGVWPLLGAVLYFASTATSCGRVSHNNIKLHGPVLGAMLVALNPDVLLNREKLPVWF